MIMTMTMIMIMINKEISYDDLGDDLDSIEIE
jgi:hypothetical protein